MPEPFWRRTPLDTERLRIRRFRPAVDAAAMAAVYADAEVMRLDTGEVELAGPLPARSPAAATRPRPVRSVLAARGEPLVAAVDAENAPSLRLADRVGLRRREQRVLHGRPHVVFERPRTVSDTF